MTTLSETNRYRINGVLDTEKPVIENIENICNSCMSWFTYDNTTGKWGVVINRAEVSAYSFNDNNIVGAINVTTRGVEDLYNSLEVNYPDRDLLDVNNTREHTIPSNLEAANEPYNRLDLSYNLISDQIIAQNLAISELHAMRTDLSITFATSYTMNELEIGDVVDITNSIYGWSAKLFRILNIREEDTPDGNIVYSISASEYRDDIYNHVTVRTTEDPTDGINTIANIGNLTNPVISKGEEEEKPFLQFSSTIPGTGSPVTEVEVWAYQITDPTELANWNDTVLYPDALRAYDLLFTRKSPRDEPYTPGASWEARTEDLAAGDYLFKLRPANSFTKGAFTDYLTTGVITFEPDVGGAVFDSINNNKGTIPVITFDRSQSWTGLSTDATAPAPGAFPTVRYMPTTPSNWQFTPTVSGTYNIRIIADQDGSGAEGGRGSTWSEVDDYVAAGAFLAIASPYTIVGEQSSGGTGAFFWTDFAMSFQAILTAGVTYQIDPVYLAYTGSNPGDPIDWSVNVTASLAP